MPIKGNHKLPSQITGDLDDAKLAGRADTAADVRRPRISILAVGLILLVAAIWSTVAGMGLLGWDPHAYYSLLQEKTWLDTYPFEPTLFLVATAAHPWSFPSYIFVVITISLSILLIAFWRLKYTPLDQSILILFFSCSFYGLHFMVAFQRQFLGIVLFLLAISAGPGRIPARIGSLFSQLFTVNLHIFWAASRLRPRTASLLGLMLVAVAGFYRNALASDPSSKSGSYGTYGEMFPVHLVIKQCLTILIAILILTTLREGRSRLKSAAYAYITLSAPCLFWPFYAGMFSRMDYFFFPVIIALWPGYLKGDRRGLFRLTIVSFSIIGCYIWIKSNLACEVMGFCEF